MKKRIISIGLLFLATSLALSWYPLNIVSDTRIGNTQLLFFAFASASIGTMPLLAYQVKRWRGRSASLFGIAFTGSIMLTALHYSLLNGDPLVVFSLFCLVPIIILFLLKTLSRDTLQFSKFLVMLMIIISIVIILFGLRVGLSFQWSKLTAAIAGGACYLLFRLHVQDMNIPIASKASSIFIFSTWLTGMIIIFTPSVVNFPQDNALSLSAAYGVLCVAPILFGILSIMASKTTSYFVLWLVFLLVASLISVELFEAPEYKLLAAVLIILSLAGWLQIKIAFKELSFGD